MAARRAPRSSGSGSGPPATIVERAAPAGELRRDRQRKSSSTSVRRRAGERFSVGPPSHRIERIRGPLAQQRGQQRPDRRRRAGPVDLGRDTLDLALGAGRDDGTASLGVLQQRHVVGRLSASAPLTMIAGGPGSSPSRSRGRAARPTSPAGRSPRSAPCRPRHDGVGLRAQAVEELAVVRRRRSARELPSIAARPSSVATMFSAT